MGIEILPYIGSTFHIVVKSYYTVNLFCQCKIFSCWRLKRIMKGNTKEDGASALKKGLSVLSCFSWQKSRRTLTEIARELNLPLPTAARLAKALEGQGFLEREKKSRLYSLGFQCYLLGAIAKKTGGLRTLALPCMEELRKRFNETVNLYVREGDFRICYEQVESSLNLKRSAKLGDRFPLWAGASGRCFLAFMPEEEVSRILDEAQSLTPNTILDKKVVTEKNSELRKRGYSFSLSEREQGVSSVAVPIFDASLQPVACMTLSGPTARFTEKMIHELIPALKKTCLDLSLKLGAERRSVSLLETDR